MMQESLKETQAAATSNAVTESMADFLPSGFGGREYTVSAVDV